MLGSVEGLGSLSADWTGSPGTFVAAWASRTRPATVMVLTLLALAMAWVAPSPSRAANDATDVRLDSLLNADAYAEAVVEARRALRTLHVPNEAPGPRRVRLLNTVGLSLDELGSVEAARETLGLAVRECEALPDFPCDERADILDRFGVFLGRLGWNEDAEPLLLRAVEIGRTCPEVDQIVLAKHLNNLGTLQVQMEKRVEGEVTHREVLRLRRESLGPDDAGVALALRQLSLAITGEGRSEERILYMREALRIARLRESPTGLASTLANCGLELLDSDPIEAESLLVESLRIRLKVVGPRHRSTAHSLSCLAYARARQKRWVEADSLYQGAQTVLESLGEMGQPRLPGTLLNRARALWELGDVDRAEQLTLRARELLRESDVYRIGWSAERDLAKYACKRGDLVAATRHLESSLTLSERGRLDRGRPLEVASSVKAPYLDLACVELERGRGIPAWTAMERGLSRGMRDLVRQIAAEGESASDRRIADSLAFVLDRLETKFEFADHPFQGAIGDSLLQARLSWSQHEARVTTRAFQRPEVTLDLAAVQAKLRPDEAVVAWIDPGEVVSAYAKARSWACVLRQAGPPHWIAMEGPESQRIPGDTLTIRGSLEAYLGFLASSRRSPIDRGLASRAAAVLFEARVAPLAPHLEGITHVLVVPSGLMQGVPIDALCADAAIEDSEYASIGFSYISGGAILAWLRDRQDGPTVPRRVLIIGDPIAAEERAQPRVTPAAGAPLSLLASSRAGSAGLDPIVQVRLSGARQEIRDVACLVPEARVESRERASEAELNRLAMRDSLKTFDVIHFANHAEVDNGRFNSACLLLSEASIPVTERGGMEVDGRVGTTEILRRWRLNASLVVLSGCRTGGGRTITGEGVVGFAHALFPAGARCLLVSLWSVDDQATALLMRYFYEAWFGTTCSSSGDSSGSSAPRRARLALRQALESAKARLRAYRDAAGVAPYEDPHYWSAFVLLGDAR